MGDCHCAYPMELGTAGHADGGERRLLEHVATERWRRDSGMPAYARATRLIPVTDRNSLKK